MSLECLTRCKPAPEFGCTVFTGRGTTSIEASSPDHQVVPRSDMPTGDFVRGVAAMREQARASADRRVTLLGPLFLLLLGAHARAAEPEWKVGLAQVKITPERPVFMAGYASRDKPFEKVAADLLAQALALDELDGHVTVR